ncbi:MAG: hypothetical protein M3R65_01585 [Gemmatimonadota bacterium]|nr:hypothetical protein [Gemmatimonadota bacterium]
MVDAMRIRTIGFLGFVAATAGCSSDRAYAPPGTVLTDAQVSSDIAATAGMAAATSLAEQTDFLGGAGVSPSMNTFGPLIPTGQTQPVPGASTAPAPAAARPACTYTAKTGAWNCASFVNAHGQTVTMSYAYMDASGGAMQQYSATLTERIIYNSQLDGPVGDGATLTGTTHRKQQQILSGLSGKEVTRIWNGSGVSSDTTDYHTPSVSRHYVGAEVDSLKNVVYPQPRTAGSYPLSGEIVRVANYTATAVGKTTESRSVSRTVLTTFNGTANVTVKTGHVTCTLHLDTRKVDGCVSG